MSSYVSVHFAHKISARAGTTGGAPLIVTIDREHGGNLPDELTLFTDDHELSRKLADAINAAVAEHKAAQTEFTEAAE